jgi:hypothetical protein
MDSGIGVGERATGGILPWVILFLSLCISCCCSMAVFICMRPVKYYDCNNPPDRRKVSKQFYRDWEDYCRSRADGPLQEKIGLMAMEPFPFAS